MFFGGKKKVLILSRKDSKKIQWINSHTVSSKRIKWYFITWWENKAILERKLWTTKEEEEEETCEQQKVVLSELSPNVMPF